MKKKRKKRVQALKQDYQKTEAQWILKDHAECWAILKRTVSNHEMSKKCNCRHTHLNDNFLIDEVRML